MEYKNKILSDKPNYNIYTSPEDLEKDTPQIYIHMLSNQRVTSAGEFFNNTLKARGTLRIFIDDTGRDENKWRNLYEAEKHIYMWATEILIEEKINKFGSSPIGFILEDEQFRIYKKGEKGKKRIW